MVLFCFLPVLFLVSFSVSLLNAEQYYVVPNIVHQTYDYQSPNFFMYMSIKCVQYFIKPLRHVLWVNDEGKYRKNHWESWQSKTVEGTWEHDFVGLLKSGKIETVPLTYPMHPPGNESVFVSNKAHRSDFVRMSVLLKEGGVYLDTDAFPTKSLDELRIHNFTLAFDNIVNPDKNAPKRLNNGVIFSVPNAPFLRIWTSTYSSFDPSSWDYHSSIVPFQLATEYPDLVHIEMSRISPLSYGFQTSAAAAALTCGIYMSSERAVWHPRYDAVTKRYTFAGTSPDTSFYNSLGRKLILHLTMSAVRYVDYKIFTENKKY